MIFMTVMIRYDNPKTNKAIVWVYYPSISSTHKIQCRLQKHKYSSPLVKQPADSDNRGYPYLLIRKEETNELLSCIKEYMGSIN